MKDLFIGSDPAFPSMLDVDARVNPEYGMSKRFYAACAAMQGLCAVNDKGTFASIEDVYKKLINHSYALADELLKQEQNEKNN